MKRTVYLLAGILFLVVGFNACNSSDKTMTVNGIVMDATMNNIMLITTQGDTIDISTMNTDPAKVPGILIDDSVKVTYKKEKMENATILKAQELIVTVHSPYYYIQGTWLEPNPINATEQQGFTLNQDGTAVSVNMATLKIKNWNLENKVLLLGYESIGNGQTIEGVDTLNVIKLNADSLVLAKNQYVTWRLAREK